MDNNKFKNSLTGAPIIDKPRLGFGRKRVIDGNGKIIGSVSGNKIFDLNGRLWGRIVTRDEASGFNKNEIVDRGTVIATIDAKRNIYRKKAASAQTSAEFVGTIKTNKTTTILLPLLVALLLVTAVTSVVLGKIIKDNSEPDYLKRAPVIDVLSQVGERSWKQYSKLAIFKSSQYESKYIAPNDKGTYVFIIKNEDTHAINYSVNLASDDKYGWPMVYKLTDDTRARYFIGERGTADTTYVQLGKNGKSTIQLTLDPGATQALVLHWWWNPNISDEKDTNIGSHQYEYKLDLTVSAEFVG